MARTNSLTNFLTDVADAIKEKKGSEADITASNFDTEILNLPAQGAYQHKTVSVSQNGTSTVIPDSGYDAIDQLTINTTVPEKQLQTKTYNFTQNASLQLNPDTGYDGFDKVNLTINVSGGGSGDVKLFETEQAMQADPDAEDDDLAIVYRSTSVSVTAESQFDSCIFPATVILPEAFTSTANGYFEAVDGSYFNGQIFMEDTYFEFTTYGSMGQEVISYTSSDGITYTRTDGGDPQISFGATIQYVDWAGPFNPVFGYFMQINGHAFKGLYKYSTEIDTNYYTFGTLISGGTNGQPLWDKLYPIYKPDIHDLIVSILQPYNYSSISYLLVDEGNDLYSAYYSTSSSQTGAYACTLDWFNNTLYARRSNASGYDHSYKLSIDMTNQTCTRTEVTSKTMTISGTSVEYLEELDGNIAMIYSSQTVYYYNTSSNSVSSFSLNFEPLEISKYRIAETQFSLTAKNELLPGKIAYGKNGEVTGDGSIYSNLDGPTILTQYLGISAEEISNANYSAKYPSLYDKTYDGYKFAYTWYPISGSINYLKSYHLEPIGNNENKLWLAKLIKIPDMDATSCKGAFISFDKYNKVYIIVGYADYSNKGNLYIAVYDENMQLIKSHSNVSNSNSVYPNYVFYYNNNVYIVTTANSYSYLNRVSGSSLTRLYTQNQSTPRIAVDYVSGECYMQQYYADTSTYMPKVNLSTGTASNVDIATDVCSDGKYICYITSSAIKYKKLGDASFRSISKPTSVTNKEWGIASNENYLAIVCSSYYVLVNLSDNTSQVMATSVEMGTYPDRPYPSLIGTNLYLMNRVSELYKINSDGTGAKYITNGLLSNYMSSSLSRFEMIDDFSFMYLKSDISTVYSTKKATAIALKLRLYDVGENLDPDKFSFILPDQNTGLRLSGTIDIDESTNNESSGGVSAGGEEVGGID